MRKALLSLILFSSLSRAQWTVDGVVVCDTNANAGIYTLPRIASDGEGGAFICWRDLRNGDYDVYAQRVDSAGRVLWPKNGVAIVKTPQNQDFPVIASDNRRGAFIGWEDDRSVSNTNVYVQRLNSEGQALWQINGVEAALTPGLFVSLATDGVGGVILGWSTVEDVYVQRLDSLGNRVWGDSGIQVTNRPGQISPGDVAVVGDGSGGEIVVWAEGTYPMYRVYTQHIDGSGTIRWSTNGILLSDSTIGAGGVALSPDLNGGAIIDWNNFDGTAKAQKVDAQGQKKWGNLGLPLFISGPGGSRRNNSDGKGGAFIGKGLWIHHLDSLGTEVWGDSGTAFINSLSANDGVSYSSQSIDGRQGIYNFAEYFQNGAGRYIQSQWIDSTGTARFGANGKHVIMIPNGLQFMGEATTDERGGAIVCWNDFRRGYSDVYVACVDTSGTVTKVRSEGVVFPPVPILNQNYPNPFNPETTITFTLPGREFATLKVFDVLGREIVALVNGNMPAGVHSVRFSPRNISTGVFFYRLTTKESTIVRKMLLVH